MVDHYVFFTWPPATPHPVLSPPLRSAECAWKQRSRWLGRAPGPL